MEAATPGTTRCDSCGEQYSIGDWPFCPHGKANFFFSSFEPYIDEHIVSEDHPAYNPKAGGVVMTDRAQKRELMKEQNLHSKPKRVGMPGCEV